MNLDIDKMSLQELKNVLDMIFENLDKHANLFGLLKDRLFKLDDSNTELSERIKVVEKGLENYREYRTDIEDLETDVMYLTERVKKIESLIGNAVKEKIYGDKK